MKKSSIRIKRTIAAVIFLVALYASNEWFRFLLIDDVNSYTRITMHEFYEQENIDVLLLGSSHVYRSLDPKILDQKWGVNTFNAGSGSQTPIISYYLLKEAVREHDLSKVYLELYYDLLWENVDYQSSTSLFIISDYMKNSPNRLAYLWEAAGQESLVHGLILGRRNWDKLLDFSYQADLLKRKAAASYRNYEYVTYENEAYRGKGFVDNQDIIEQGSFGAEAEYAPIGKDCISSQNKEYLEKIIALCQKEEIELVFYSAPIPDFRLYSVGNYDSFKEHVEELLEGTGVPYYDFSMSRDEFLHLEDSDFKDDNHLNGIGAQKFTNTFADFFENKPDVEQCFWPTYQEKVESMPPQVFGLICFQERMDEETLSIEITPITNSPQPLYYSVYRRDENDEEYQLVSDFSKVTKLEFPVQGSGYFRIYASSDETGREITNKTRFHY